MDAGPLADLPPGVDGKRLPAWLMLPGLTDEERAKLRPDVFIIKGFPTPAKDAPDLQIWQALLHSALATFHIFEAGYGNDTNQEDKDLEKQAQHAKLLALLTQIFGAHRVHLHTVPLGRCGAIPASLKKTLIDLGFTAAKADKCTHKLHVHAVQWVEKMYTYRQSMDRPQAGDTAPPHPPNMNPLVPRRPRHRPP